MKARMFHHMKKFYLSLNAARTATKSETKLFLKKEIKFK
jgi:hypothetical protein